MADVVFQIPTGPPDTTLLRKKATGVYLVQDLQNVSSLATNQQVKDINRLGEKLEEDPMAIVENGVFDVLFSYCYKFKEVSEDTVKRRLWETLRTACRSLCSFTRTLLNKSMEIHRPQLPRLQNAFRMLSYLMYLFTVSAEKEAQKRLDAQTLSHPRAKVKAKKNDNWWLEVQTDVLGGALEILESDLSKVWNNGIPDEEFLNLFTKVASQVLEHPTSTGKNNTELRNFIFKILESLCITYEQSVGVSNMLLELIIKHEHVALAAPDLIVTIATKQPAFTGSIIREISCLESNVSEATGIRNISTFLSAITERLPTQVKDYISQLVNLLGHESYVLRNGLIQAIGHIIAHGFEKQEDEAEMEESQSRMNALLQLCEVLLTREHDMASYTRAKAMQTWLYLANNGKIPKSCYTAVAKSAVGRLEDKTAQVRRYAIELVTAMIEHNMFAQKLRLSIILKEIEKVQVELRSATVNTTTEQNEEEEEDVSDTADSEKGRLTIRLEFLESFKDFLEAIDSAIPVMVALLGSKSNTDVHEAVRFFVTASNFGVERADEGARKIIGLIWSKEPTTKDVVIQAFKDLYLSPPVQDRYKKQEDLFIACTLVRLAIGLSASEQTSFAELISIMTSRGEIQQNVQRKIFEIFLGREGAFTKEQSKGALMIWSMMAKADPNLVKDHLKTLVKNGLGARWKEDEDFAKYTCIAVQRLATPDKETKIRPPRFSPSDPLLQSVVRILLENSASTAKWFPAAEQAINVIYDLSEQPNSICTRVIHELASRLFSPSSSDMHVDGQGVSPAQLSKFIFVLGHVAMRHMQFLDDIHGELSRRKAAAEKKSENGADPSLADELGINSATDEVEEVMKLITEKHLVCSNLLGSFAKLIVAVCKNEGGRFNDPILRSSAVVALCKYMCVSSEFCNAHLRLLFTLLQDAPEPWIRSNIIIALGDLVSRFPNELEEWTEKIYARLGDKDTGVRKNALMVLSHLILNDTVKVKGQISEIAICVVDKDPRISDLARLFFHELNNKGNCVSSIYNVLSDIISNLLSPHVASDTFRKVMKYILQFIDKEKQIESVVDRICKQRLRSTNDPAQAADIAYCLSLMNYTNEKPFRKLADNFKCYQDKLVIDSVYDSFMLIVQKAKKSRIPREELEEFERRITAINKGHTLDMGDEADPAMVDEEGTQEDKPAKKTARRAASTRKRRGPARKKKEEWEDDDDDTIYAADDDETEGSDMMAVDDSEEAEEAPAKSSRQPRRNTRARKARPHATRRAGGN